MRIALKDIKPSPRPVRSSWDDDKLNELAQSIKEQGLIVPVKVRPADGGYELVYGHRRVEAMRRAGVAETDAIVEGVDDTTALVQALIENVQREDMNPLDKARALQDIRDETGWTLPEIERRGIMTDHQASRLLALLGEPETIQKKVIAQGETGITERHVRAARVAGLNEPQRVAVIEKAEREELTSGQAANVAQAIARAPNEKTKEKLLDLPYRGNVNLWEAHAHEMAEVERKREKPTAAEWAIRQEVSSVLSAIKDFERNNLAEWKRLVEMGKFSPEGVAFFARRLRILAGKINDLADWAENWSKNKNG